MYITFLFKDWLFQVKNLKKAAFEDRGTILALTQDLPQWLVKKKVSALFHACSDAKVIKFIPKEQFPLFIQLARKLSYYLPDLGLNESFDQKDPSTYCLSVDVSSYERFFGSFSKALDFIDSTITKTLNLKLPFVVSNSPNLNVLIFRLAQNKVFENLEEALQLVKDLPIEEILSERDEIVRLAKFKIFKLAQALDNLALLKKLLSEKSFKLLSSLVANTSAITKLRPERNVSVFKRFFSDNQLDIENTIYEALLLLRQKFSSNNSCPLKIFIRITGKQQFFREIFRVPNYFTECWCRDLARVVTKKLIFSPEDLTVIGLDPYEKDFNFQIKLFDNRQKKSKISEIIGISLFGDVRKISMQEFRLPELQSKLVSLQEKVQKQPNYFDVPPVLFKRPIKINTIKLVDPPVFDFKAIIIDKKRIDVKKTIIHETIMPDWWSNEINDSWFNQSTKVNPSIQLNELNKNAEYNKNAEKIRQYYKLVLKNKNITLWVFDIDGETFLHGIWA
jgi:hypothetical protein